MSAENQRKVITLEPGSKLWHEWRDRCLKPIPGKYSALYHFVGKVLGLEDKIPLRPQTHYALALFAERATGIPEIDSARVQLIQVARGFGKSALVTTGRSLQRLCANPDWTMGIGNETQGMASTFLGGIKEHIESNDFLRALFPEIVPDNFRDTTWREDEIVIKRPGKNPAPSVLAVGVGGTKTGIHINEWVIDDVISQNAAENALRGSFSEIEAANRWIIRLPPLLNAPERDPITFIGTPWFANDSYTFIEQYFGGTEDLRSKPDFETIWTLTLPDGTKQHIHLYRRGDIAVFKRPALINGKSIFPERWTTEELERMATRPGSAQFFQANYMLNPTGGIATTFRMDWLKYYELEDNKRLLYTDQLGMKKVQLVKDLVTYISVDPAFSDKQTSARTAIPVVGLNGKEIFLLEDFAEHGVNVDEIGRRVVALYLKYKPHKIFVETIVAQIAVADAIRRVAKESGITEELPIEEIRSHGRDKKDWRIFGLEPFFAKEQFYLHKSHHNFTEEYSAFPLGKMRDLLDAISFQRDAWERAFQHGTRGNPSLDPQARRVAESSAIARIAKAFKPRRSRG
jgi:hypothetical protein